MKRWTEEDLTPFVGVGAVIEGSTPGHVLMQKHVKLQKWTIPVGKASLSDDPKLELIRELKEETGITATKLRLIHHGHDTYPAEPGRPSSTHPAYIYLVEEYEGTPKNCEPHKHSEQDFMDPHELILKGEPISIATQNWLKYKRKQK